MSVDGLIAFWRARLGEDEAAAKAAAEISRITQWVIGEVNDDGTRDVRPANDDLEWVAGHIAGADATHIAAHDPARALRDVAADRAILEAYEGVAATREALAADLESSPVLMAAYTETVYHLAVLENVIRHRAGVHSDHPEYKPEWAPQTLGGWNDG